MRIAPPLLLALGIVIASCVFGFIVWLTTGNAASGAAACGAGLLVLILIFGL